MSKLAKAFMVLAAFLLIDQQDVLHGAIGHRVRAESHESNPEKDNIGEILHQFENEVKRKNAGGQLDCPDGFAYASSMNRCYRIMPDVLQTRLEAAYECRKRHGRAHLPVIQNEQQQNTIVNILKSYQDMCPAGMWTSGRRSHPFRSFSWEPSPNDTKRAYTFTYTNWAKNRPWFAYGLNRNCLYMDPSKAWKWNQLSCEAKLCVMCEIHLL